MIKTSSQTEDMHGSHDEQHHDQNYYNSGIEKDSVPAQDTNVSSETIDNEKRKISATMVIDTNSPSVSLGHTTVPFINVSHENDRRIESPTEEQSKKPKNVSTKRNIFEPDDFSKIIANIDNRKKFHRVIDSQDKIPYGQTTPYNDEDSGSLRTLGEGAFGTVYDSTDETLNRRMAFKRMSVVDDEGYKIAQHELNAIKEIGNTKNTYIVTYYRAAMIRKEDHVALHIFMEYMHMSVTTFYKRLHSLNLETPVQQVVIRRITHDMTSALYYLEQKDIIHRDIKPDNMLVNKDGQFKLCDLGLCTSRSELIKKGNYLVGTTYYTPPQAAKDPIHDDMWRFGFSLLEISNNKHPYPYPDSVDRTVTLQKETWNPVFTKAVSRPIRRIIRRLLEKDAPCRPNSFNDILKIRHISQVNLVPQMKELNIILRIIHGSLDDKSCT